MKLIRRRRRARDHRVGRVSAFDAWGDPDQALAAASKLVAAGEPVDAIRLLTRANRVTRNRRIEQRLVELRFDAFRATRWSANRPEWPETVDDRFPGALVPEVEHAGLTVERLRSAITRHGSLIVRGLLGAAQVDRLVGDIDRTLDAFDAEAEGVRRDDLDGWYQTFEHDPVSDRPRKRFRGAVMTVESPPTLFDLVETFEDSGLGQLARDYFGEPPAILARKAILRRMSHEGKTGGWHQDGAFLGADVRSLNVWIALSHCGDSAPGIDVVGRRLDHIVETGKGAFAEWATDPDAAEEAGAGAIVRPIFEPGDALLFDQMNLHRTAIDPGMEHDRYAIETWMLGPSTYGAMTTPIEDGYSPQDQFPILF